MTTVVVVHETATPEVLRLVALCEEHVKVLDRASWARLDELVGFSTVMGCEACALIPEPTLPDRQYASTRPAARRHLRPLPASA
jgi:hypothetical protein